MMEALRRRLAKSDDGYDWPLQEELEPESEGHPDVADSGSNVLSPPSPAARFSPADPNSQGYYEGMVKAAIEHGGECAGHHIPVPWLKMILAGLEFRQVEPEALWDGVEAPSAKEDWSYYSLFPSEKELLAA